MNNRRARIDRRYKEIHSTLGLSTTAQPLLSQGCGRALLLASRADEPAHGLHGDRNGLFTKPLLAGLAGGMVRPGGLVWVFNYRQDVFLHALARGPDRQWLRTILRPALEKRGLRVSAADR